jgi:two-component system alkaline phosphatase synthesis response regulator PhoP
MALIYIVEDDKNISEIESFALRNAGHQVVEFETAKEYYKMVQSRIPDLVMLDVMLPDEDGLAVLTRIRRTPETRKVPVILVTAKTSEIDKVKGLDLGADDYMTKPFGVMELISRVKAILRRVEGMERERFIRVGMIYIDDERHVAYVNDIPVDLTYKEYELLKYLTLNQGIVLSRENIMEKIWNFNYGGESRTLDVHIKTLRQKLNEAGSYIKTVRNVGYFLETDNTVRYSIR